MSYYPTTYGNLSINVPPIPSGLPGTGQYMVSTGTATTWASSTTWNQNVTLTGKVIQCDEDADIKFGDVSLMETLREIKSQLGILTPEPKLEEEFEELKACAQEYERLRAKFLDQKRVWDTLKKQDF